MSDYDKTPNGIKGVKVMKVSPKQVLVEENKETGKGISNELHIQCPHCNKELYIKRDTLL
jgi:hypothetical protein